MKLHRLAHVLRVCVLVCVLACAACISGCAGTGMGKGGAESFMPPAGGLFGTWTFRHAVVLELPGADLSLPFTGVMRLDADAGHVHAVAVSAMGLTLLDMTVDATGHTARFVHPSLSRLPHAAANAASAIRFLWLGKIVPGDSPMHGATALTEGFANGWAKKITLSGEGFVLRLTLVDSRRDGRQ